MIKDIINSIRTTDIFPIGGGGIGALTQTESILIFPPFEAIVYTICIAVIGAITGYGVKLILDFIILKIKEK